MQSSSSTPATIDDYIAEFPEAIQKLLKKIRSVIRRAAPGATEKISYRMPTFYLHGNLVHFAAFKNHIGFFPAASGIEAFKKEITNFAWSKGTVQFPFDKPIPYDLIERIVKFRVMENLAKATGRRKAQASH